MDRCNSSFVLHILLDPNDSARFLLRQSKDYGSVVAENHQSNVHMLSRRPDNDNLSRPPQVFHSCWVVSCPACLPLGGLNTIPSIFKWKPTTSSPLLPLTIYSPFSIQPCAILQVYFFAFLLSSQRPPSSIRQFNLVVFCFGPSSGDCSK